MWVNSLQLEPYAATRGILRRRVGAYVLDLVFVTLLLCVVTAAASVVTLLSLGILHAVWAVIPFTALIYSTLTIGGATSATWGMRMTGISYCRLDGSKPDYGQALAVTVIFYLTMGATGGLVLLVALFTDGHRTLHDMLAGLIMVRTDRR